MSTETMILLGIWFVCLLAALGLVGVFGPRPNRRSSSGGMPVRETEGGRLYARLAKNRCPDCGGTGFFEGPSGGMSTNIYCVNPDCRQGFNITPVVEIAERIGSAHGRFDHWYMKSGVGT